MSGAASGGLLEPGARLADRYVIGAEIGRGGLSVVYDARDAELGHDVALKLLVPPPGGAEIARERMRREVLAARSLRHAHIVKVFDIQDEGSWTFVVMEKIVGRDLHSRVTSRGALPGDQVLGLGREMADALCFAHRAGVLHRDIKPHNILIEEATGRAVLTDFGSARIDGQATLTAAGDVVGTLAYMAPEELRGRRADARSDLYSLGMTLYFAATGSLPGAGSGPTLPPPPRDEGFRASKVVAVPQALDDAIARATCAEPTLRFQTGALMSAALADGDPVEAAASTATVATLVEADRRCLLCGGPEPFGTALCVGCAKRDAPDDLDVILEGGGASLPQLMPRLRAWSGDQHRDDALRDTALGRRPLLRVSADAAEAVLAALARLGIRARTQARGRTDRLVPTSLQATIAGVMIVAALCVMLGGAFVGAGGFALAAVLFVRAQSLAGKPLLAASEPTARRAEWLPPNVEQQVVDALSGLPSGTAQGLLADMVRLLRPKAALHGAPAAGMVTALSERANDLLLATCAGARELAELDGLLEMLESRRHQQQLPGSWRESLARAEQARDALAQRLLESAGALGLAGGLRDDSEGFGDHLAELTRELESEIAIQAEAAKEAAECDRG
jgi:hypothetical protein